MKHDKLFLQAVKSHQKTVIGFVPSVQLLVYLPSVRRFHTYYQLKIPLCFISLETDIFCFLFLCNCVNRIFYIVSMRTGGIANVTLELLNDAPSYP
jgi:hypothetical protein